MEREIGYRLGRRKAVCQAGTAGGILNSMNRRRCPVLSIGPAFTQLPAMKPQAKLWVAAGLIALAMGGAYGVYHWQLPYGPRTCCLPCLMSALRSTAEEDDGRYPDDLFATNTLSRLGAWGIREQLAGLSGDIPATLRRLEVGLPLDTNVSSWVYWPGFRADDPAELAILWDRTEGLAFNALRSKYNAVGFADGSHGSIPRTEWAAFLKTQADLRARVLSDRTTPPVPAVFKPAE